MTTDFVQRRKELNQGIRKLNEVNPAVMSGFGKMHRAANADGELSAKTKELIALAISITSHCEGCVAFHTHDALRAGATPAEVAETIGVAVLMGGGPAVMYASDALEALEQFQAAGAE